jgi:hypothetical protein
VGSKSEFFSSLTIGRPIKSDIPRVTFVPDSCGQHRGDWHILCEFLNTRYFRQMVLAANMSHEPCLIGKTCITKNTRPYSLINGIHTINNLLLQLHECYRIRFFSLHFYIIRHLNNNVAAARNIQIKRFHPARCTKTHCGCQVLRC